MSEPSSLRRVLHLVMEGFPADQIEALASTESEIFELTEANAREALEKIFAADTVAVWGKISHKGSQ